jgi:hypothetical protein
MDEALKEIAQLDPAEEIPYTRIAKKHGVVRSTLARRWERQTQPHATKILNQQKLNPQQEEELAKYIEKLTERHLAPTREMIQNFGESIAKQKLSQAWVTRFIHRNQHHFTTRWTTAMDANRHAADSGDKYRQYFDLLEQKIVRYDVKPENTYNMDEKGFMIGHVGRSKRVFSKRKYMKKQYRQSLQDGNREWVTLLATVCADGTSLPPHLVYEAAGKAIQSNWVQDIDAEKHSVHVSVSPSGWTNNDIGLAWLEQVFDRYTKDKARRKYRLLILDGHGSHLTDDFLEYCHNHKILLVFYPPHSTQTVQPLDVVMFKPLSSAYSKKVSNQLHSSQNLLEIKKGSFFLLFWESWVESFTKSNILSSFKATGIHPWNPDVILSRFTNSDSERSGSSP